MMYNTVEYIVYLFKMNDCCSNIMVLVSVSKLYCSQEMDL